MAILGSATPSKLSHSTGKAPASPRKNPLNPVTLNVTSQRRIGAASGWPLKMSFRAWTQIYQSKNYF